MAVPPGPSGTAIVISLPGHELAPEPCRAGVPGDKLSGRSDSILCEIRTKFAATYTRGYCTAFIMSKIGRYIATTIPPTTTPRITIIAGSMRLISELTATSTSSS
jgi:hypothetical protein